MQSFCRWICPRDLFLNLWKKQLCHHAATCVSGPRFGERGNRRTYALLSGDVEKSMHAKSFLSREAFQVATTKSSTWKRMPRHRQPRREQSGSAESRNQPPCTLQRSRTPKDWNALKLHRFVCWANFYAFSSLKLLNCFPLFLFEFQHFQVKSWKIGFHSESSERLSVALCLYHLKNKHRLRQTPKSCTCRTQGCLERVHTILCFDDDEDDDDGDEDNDETEQEHGWYFV